MRRYHKNCCNLNIKYSEIKGSEIKVYDSDMKLVFIDDYPNGIKTRLFFETYTEIK